MAQQTDRQQQMALAQQMVSQRAWVRTPWKYTTLGTGLSLVQQQALLMVSEHLQGYIHKFFDLKLDKAVSVREFFPESIASRSFDELTVVPAAGSESDFSSCRASLTIRKPGGNRGSGTAHSAGLHTRAAPAGRLMRCVRASVRVPAW